jgi:hypothetical protein|tara:strand:- start:275 stop:493 length:219 start_codon:yes stop_codon:yes gene_type:complete
MTNKKQEQINQLWERYAKTLGLLNATLDELEKKPKEVIVEVEADVDLSTPPAIAELEKQVQEKLNKDDSTEE